MHELVRVKVVFAVLFGFTPNDHLEREAFMKGAPEQMITYREYLCAGLKYPRSSRVPTMGSRGPPPEVSGREVFLDSNP